MPWTSPRWYPPRQFTTFWVTTSWTWEKHIIGWHWLGQKALLDPSTSKQWRSIPSTTLENRGYKWRPRWSLSHPLYSQALWTKWNIHVLKYVGKDLDPRMLFESNSSFTPVGRMESSNRMMAHSLKYKQLLAVGKRRSWEKQSANVVLR